MTRIVTGAFLAAALSVCMGATKPHPATTDKECIACHKDEAKLAKGHFGQPVLKSACARCHDVKAEAPPYLIAADVHPPYASRQCGICHGESRTADCLGCHVKLKAQLDKNGSIHNLLEKRNCTLCHDPHASERARLFKRPKDELCTSCHGGIPTAEFMH